MRCPLFDETVDGLRRTRRLPTPASWEFRTTILRHRRFLRRRDRCGVLTYSLPADRRRFALGGAAFDLVVADEAPGRDSRLRFLTFSMRSDEGERGYS